MFTSVTRSQNRMLLLLVFLLGLIIFTLRPPDAVDWRETFSQIRFGRPYDQPNFIGMPWTSILLAPFQLVPVPISLIFNAAVTLFMTAWLISRRSGNAYSLLLIFTSFPFLSTIANGQIEWLPMLGFIMQSSMALPLLMIKPQSGILVILTWMTTKSKAIEIFLIGLATLLLSWLLWGNWAVDLLTNIRYVKAQSFGLDDWNVALFPFLIPVGLALIFYVWKYKPADQELLAALSTYCIVPYFGMYSLLIPFTLLCATHRRIAAFVWILLWVYPIVSG